jgi:protein O-mannosyl-transferase
MPPGIEAVTEGDEPVPKMRKKTASGSRGEPGVNDAKPIGSGHQGTSTRDTALICLALAIITLISFWGVFGNEFLHTDDADYITNNSIIQAGFTRSALTWAFNIGYAGNWHPLTWMSHMLDCRLFGLNPVGPHAVNLLLHIASTILLFLMLTRITGAPWKSAFVAAVFAIHPLRVESVAWAAERKDVLSVFFWMLTTWAYISYTERPNWKRYVPIAVFLTLGLMAKQMLVTLPFALLLLDYWPLRRLQTADNRLQRGLGKLVLEKVPLFALSAAASVLVFLAQKRDGAVWRSEGFSLLWRASNSAMSYARYIGKMVWPTKLSYFYVLIDYRSLLWQSVVVGAALLIITVLVVRGRLKRPYLLVGWLWYIGTLVPVIGLLQIGGQSMADRYTYIPSIGILIMVAWGIPDLLRKGERENGRKGDPESPNTQNPTPNTHTPTPPYSHTLPLAVASLAIVVVLAACTHIQVGYWHDDISLCRHAIKYDNRNYMAHATLGIVLSEEGKHLEAIREYRQALVATPHYPLAHAALGGSLVELGRLREAEKEYRTALHLRPGDATTLSRLGIVLSMQRRFDEATPMFERSIRLNPHVPGTYMNLGKVYSDRKDYDDAVRVYQSALDANPDLPSTPGLAPQYAEICNSMGTALACLDKIDEATHQFEEAVRVQPGFARAHGSLAIAYLIKGDCALAWREVHLCRNYGHRMPDGFLRALSRRMPDPGP